MEERNLKNRLSPAMEDILKRLLYDQEFRELFRNNRQAALDQYHSLSDEERESLQNIPDEKAETLTKLPVPKKKKPGSYVEYAMIMGLLGMVVVGALTATGTSVSSHFHGIRPQKLMESHETCARNIIDLNQILREKTSGQFYFMDKDAKPLTLYTLMLRGHIGSGIKCPDGGYYEIVTTEEGDQKKLHVTCTHHGSDGKGTPADDPAGNTE